MVLTPLAVELTTKATIMFAERSADLMRQSFRAEAQPDHPKLVA